MSAGRGLFVVFEGGDGAGKTTQVELLAAHLGDAGRDVVVTRQPGGTALGGRLREILLHGSEPVDPRAEMLLFAADKAQHVAEVVRPALARGAVVVCDRYVDSTLAYQGAGRALADVDMEPVAWWAVDGLRPDLTVLLDVVPEAAVGTKRQLDRMESAGAQFHARVRDGFLRLAAAEPGRYLVLPARDAREEIAARVAQRVDALLA